jgi:anti-anti-sigma factor
MKADIRDNGVAVLSPKGALVGGDLLDDLKTTAQGLLAQGTRRLVIDLSGVDLVNSTGLGSLIGLHSGFRENDGTVVLSGADKKIRNLFVITRLASVFPIVDTIDEGIATASA